jgi:hypothetical protein
MHLEIKRKRRKIKGEQISVLKNKIMFLKMIIFNTHITYVKYVKYIKSFCRRINCLSKKNKVLF